MFLNTLVYSVCFKKNCRTFATLYTNKCVTIFLKQMLFLLSHRKIQLVNSLQRADFISLFISLFFLKLESRKPPNA